MVAKEISTFEEISTIEEVQILDTAAIYVLAKDFRIITKDFELFKNAVVKDINHLLQENEELKKRIEALEKK